MHNLELSIMASIAAAVLINKTEVKGRVEVRAHAKLQRALQKNCSKADGSPMAGIIELDSERIIYFKDILNKFIDAGHAPGQLAVGFEELLDLLENVKKE